MYATSSARKHHLSRLYIRRTITYVYGSTVTENYSVLKHFMVNRMIEMIFMNSSRKVGF